MVIWCPYGMFYWCTYPNHPVGLGVRRETCSVCMYSIPMAAEQHRCLVSSDLLSGHFSDFSSTLCFCVDLPWGSVLGPLQLCPKVISSTPASSNTTCRQQIQHPYLQPKLLFSVTDSQVQMLILSLSGTFEHVVRISNTTCPQIDSLSICLAQELLLPQHSMSVNGTNSLPDAPARSL